MPRSKPVRALVLAGGGAKGSYQVGVWRALQELDWHPAIITGASVGTLNGCMFTLGKAREVEELWRSLEIHDVLDVPATLNPEELNAFFQDVIRSGGLNVEPLAERIDVLIDEDAVRRAPIHFGLVMTEMSTMRSLQCPIEAIPQGRLKDYLLASSACFPALRPREIDGVKYIDGGWRDNMPLQLAASMGATELLGVDIDGIGIVRQNNTGLPTRIVRSHWNLGPTLDFDPARAARNMALGYFDTLRLFGRMGGTAYAIQPDPDAFLSRFAEGYQRLLAEVNARAPGMDRVEKSARQRTGYPAPFAPNPSAPTRGALAPLELACERLHVPEDLAYTPKLLAAAFLGSFDKDPADRFPALLSGKDGSLVAERALATAVPEEFVTALVSRVLTGMSPL
ncbi:patatin-like phospholipase family protein [Subdoligranulum variabile]|uniref:Phospholipase, patatin family n=1 Tax=Subdoligranulum variabile DSM 15176 TaxID=411471 RepID=D1PLW0_9FIRM|nr:patatin-like phospholipase family protein [Subdoligranulum variabile]EFB76408.1 phospholipase, patatin family [Subdoligranulum variabile DSM 15176]UWP67852.1 patatin-like phospholipase family protein [Subdoligranulum variabile]